MTVVSPSRQKCKHQYIIYCVIPKLKNWNLIQWFPNTEEIPFLFLPTDHQNPEKICSSKFHQKLSENSTKENYLYTNRKANCQLLFLVTLPPFLHAFPLLFSNYEYSPLKSTEVLFFHQVQVTFVSARQKVLRLSILQANCLLWPKIIHEKIWLRWEGILQLYAFLQFSDSATASEADFPTFQTK